MEKTLENKDTSVPISNKTEHLKMGHPNEKQGDASQTDNLKPKAPKPKKRKKPKDSTAPRQPLTGKHSSGLRNLILASFIYFSFQGL